MAQMALTEAHKPRLLHTWLPREIEIEETALIHHRGTPIMPCGIIIWYAYDLC